MILNYLKAAIQNFIKFKFHFIFNIFILAIGLSSFILISLYIKNELGYNSKYKNADRIYRVIRETTLQDGSKKCYPGTSGLFAPSLINDYPEVEKAVRIWRSYAFVRNGEEGSNQIVATCDPEFLELFNITMTQGDPVTALQEPSSILVTESIASKFFGSENPVGKTIKIEEKYTYGEYFIKGVIKDNPKRSTLQFDFITTTIQPFNSTNFHWNTWKKRHNWFPVETYIKLPENYNLKDLESKFTSFITKYMGQEISGYNTYHLQPIKKIHLYSKKDYGIRGSGDIGYIIMTSIIGLFILIIACVNFINVSIVKSNQRAKEIGIRKVVGGKFKQLIGQFLGESILLSFLSLPFALLLVRFFLPHFNGLVNRDLEINLFSIQDVFLLIFLIVFLGLISGCYPSFILSSTKPLNVLGKRDPVKKSRIGYIGTALIIFQFAISIFLIVDTIIINRQVKYLLNKDLGFNKCNLLHCDLFYAGYRNNEGKKLSLNYDEIKQDFLQNSNIIGTTASMGLSYTNQAVEVVRPEGCLTDDWRMTVIGVDNDYLNVYDIDLVKGQNFSIKNPGKEDTEFILNETAVKMLGWENPIGKRFEWKGSFNKKGNVIGVVKDFNYGSLHNKIGPMVLTIVNTHMTSLTFKIKSTDLDQTIEYLEGKWKNYIPDQPFNYYFCEAVIENMYSMETRYLKIFTFSALLAIFISCLGLFSLALILIDQRTKEIGILKAACGAKIMDIVKMLNKYFLRWVVVAFIIACPIASYSMNKWLDGFAYKIDLNMWYFLQGGILVLFTALLTVLWQSWQAAKRNPVEALKYE